MISARIGYESSLNLDNIGEILYTPVGCVLVIKNAIPCAKMPKT